MIFYKSRFAMQIKQGRLMNVKSLSLDQLRVSLSLQHSPIADAGRGWCLGTGHLLRNWINCKLGREVISSSCLPKCPCTVKRLQNYTNYKDWGLGGCVVGSKAHLGSILLPQ